MRYSVRGIRKLPKSTGLPSLITGPPRNAHVAVATRRPVPRAADEVAVVDHGARTHRRVRRRCAPSDRRPRPLPGPAGRTARGASWHADDRATHPVEPHAVAMRRTASNTVGSHCRPPHCSGWSRKKPTSPSSAPSRRAAAADPPSPARLAISGNRSSMPLGPTARHAVQWTSLICLPRERTGERLEHVTICVEQRTLRQLDLRTCVSVTCSSYGP